MTTSTVDSVRVVSPGRTHVGKQGFTYGSGASAETVGARQICMNVLPMPDGARAKVHYHKGIETIAYLLSGECVVYYGDALEHHLTAHAGDQVPRARGPGVRVHVRVTGGGQRSTSVRRAIGPENF